MEQKVAVEIIIPVFNEEKILEASINEMVLGLKSLECSWQIHVVENGSTDKTKELLKTLETQYSELRVSYLSSANYGKALKYGLTHSSAQYLICFDIDYFDIKFVDLAQKILSVKYDIIIASKNLLLSKDKRAFFRRFASFGFRFLLFLLFGLRVSDTHGIKAWRNSDKMKELFGKSYPGNHTYDTEVIIRSVYQDADVLEVPIDVEERRYKARSLLKRIPGTLVELMHIKKRLRK